MIYFRKYQKKNSKKYFWEYRIVYVDPFTKERKEKSKKGFESKTEAKEAAEKIEGELTNNDGTLCESNETISSFAQIWLKEYVENNVAPNTYRLNKSMVDTHIAPYFKEMKLTQLTPLIYQKFINHMAEKGKSRRTVEICHNVMHKMFEKAVRLKLVKENVTKGVTLKGRVQQKDLKFIPSDIVPDFLEACYEYGYIYWLFYKFLIETGMRKGEAAALQWTDIDLKERTVIINKTLDMSRSSIGRNTDFLFGDTKTFSSKRVISITPSLATELMFHKKQQNHNKLILNTKYRHDLNLVFARQHGEALSKTTLFNSFSRILKKVGLPHLTIHSLRHTHVVLQMEAGADLKYIQERLGHGSYQVTADVYSHISKKIDEERNEKFEEYMQKVLNKK